MRTLLKSKYIYFFVARSRHILFICLNIFLAALTGCTETPPAEQQILDQLERAKLSIENLNASDLKGLLAPEFEIMGNNKSYDYELIKKTMLVYKLRKQKINILFSSTTVSFDQYNTQLASLETDVLITGSKGLLPDDGRLYHINSQWRLYDDEWKITHLSWK